METLQIQPKMKFESSIMHEAAAEFEKRSGYEVTVIGEAIIDTICELEPGSITLYLSKPLDDSKTVEELTDKGVYTFKEDKQYGTKHGIGRNMECIRQRDPNYHWRGISE